MNCPKCGGKTKVTDVVNNFSHNETYRRRKCVTCDHVFYTTESEVDFKDEYFHKLWRANIRSNRSSVNTSNDIRRNQFGTYHIMSEETLNTIKTMRENGFSLRKISEKVGYTIAAINQRLRKMDLNYKTDKGE